MVCILYFMSLKCLYLIGLFVIFTKLFSFLSEKTFEKKGYLKLNRKLLRVDTFQGLIYYLKEFIKFYNKFD